MLLPNNVLASAKIKKKKRAFPPNPCRSSVGSAGCHLIFALRSEQCSLENTGSESTNTSSATGNMVDTVIYLDVNSQIYQ